MKRIFFSLIVGLTFLKSQAAHLPVKSYQQSRSTFTQVCSDFNLTSNSWKVPSETDKDLTIDYCQAYNAMATKLLAVVCGIHGAEGPSGCAIENQVLQKFADGFRSRGINLLFIHAANPYGFKNSRRVTENNIDLNRNFIVDDHPNNPGYEKLRAQLEPEGTAENPFIGFLRLSTRLVWRLLTKEFSREEMRGAVASGQFQHPKGLFYGGEKPEPHYEFFRDLLQKSYSGHREILVLDLHTGLGKRGVLHVIPTDTVSTGAQRMIDRMFSGNHDQTFELTPSTTQGFYKTSGSFNDFAVQLATPSQEILALTLEYGTMGEDVLSQLRSLSRMVSENQGQINGYSSEANRYQIRGDFIELFSPSSLEWHQEILDKSFGFFGLVANHF